MLEQTSTKRQGIVIVPAREAENQPMRGQKNTGVLETNRRVFQKDDQRWQMLQTGPISNGFSKAEIIRDH